MKKKSAAHRGATGIRLTALGYAMKARPGPEAQQQTVNGSSPQREHQRIHWFPVKDAHVHTHVHAHIILMFTIISVGTQRVDLTDCM